MGLDKLQEMLFRKIFILPQKTSETKVCVKNVIGLSQLFSSTYSAKFHVSLNFISNISNPSWNPHQ